LTLRPLAGSGGSSRLALAAGSLTLAVLAGGCASWADPAAGARIVDPPAKSGVRAPAIGQQWTYRVRNVYNNQIVDEVTERVVQTQPLIRLQRVSRASGALADEVQAPWGMLVQDPHWRYPVTFDKPLPAWPAGLDLTRWTSDSTRYRMLAAPDYSAHWGLTMMPRDWVKVSVPAGTFDALHYDEVINYQNEDLNVVFSERMEADWVAPEVGRWVLRRSHGTYYLPGRGSEMLEDYLQWELESWR